MLILVNLETNYCGGSAEFLVEVADGFTEEIIDIIVDEMAWQNAYETGADEEARIVVAEGYGDLDDINFDGYEYENAVDEAMGVMSTWQLCNEADREQLLEEYGKAIVIETFPDYIRGEIVVDRAV